jgi:hypothetical protein
MQPTKRGPKWISSDGGFGILMVEDRIKGRHNTMPKSEPTGLILFWI